MIVQYGRQSFGVNSGSALPWAGRLVVGGALGGTAPSSSGGGGDVVLTGAVFRQYPFGDYRIFPGIDYRQFPRG